ncbi:hypothetical protein GGI42DRAFT_309075 [Trichoderma sp. SZMC 28013]
MLLMMRRTWSDDHFASRNARIVGSIDRSGSWSCTSSSMLTSTPRSTARSIALCDMISSAHTYALRNVNLLILPCTFCQNGKTNHAYHANKLPTSGGMNRWMILTWSDCWKFLWYAVTKHICPWLTNMFRAPALAVFSIRTVNISVVRAGWPDTMCIKINNFSRNRSNDRPYSLAVVSLYGPSRASGTRNHAFRRFMLWTNCLLTYPFPFSTHGAFRPSLINEYPTSSLLLSSYTSSHAIAGNACTPSPPHIVKSVMMLRASCNTACMNPLNSAIENRMRRNIIWSPIQSITPPAVVANRIFIPYVRVSNIQSIGDGNSSVSFPTRVMNFRTYCRVRANIDVPNCRASASRTPFSRIMLRISTWRSVYK